MPGGAAPRPAVLQHSLSAHAWSGRRQPWLGRRFVIAAQVLRNGSGAQGARMHPQRAATLLDTASAMPYHALAASPMASAAALAT
jgi:hypothetical protein